LITLGVISRRGRRNRGTECPEVPPVSNFERY
jgi:hypothetical protein